MRRIYWIYFIFGFILSNAAIYGREAHRIKFLYPDSVSNSPHYLTWFTPNSCRIPIFLNGEWEYQVKKDNVWQKVSIPSVTDFQGEIIFRRSFYIDSNFQNRSIRLICYGINYYCTIFINNKFVGSHAGNNSFTLDLQPNSVKFGDENLIEIRVKTSLDAQNTLPLKNQVLRQKNYGGIYRDIYLLILPEIFIGNPKYKYDISPDYKNADLQIELIMTKLIDRVDENLSKLKYFVELWQPLTRRPIFKKSFPIDNELKNSSSLETVVNIPNPNLWTPKNPFLYTLKVYLKKSKTTIDSLDLKIGLKDFQIKDNDLFLNGQRFVLKGINWNDNYVVSGNFLDFTSMETEIESIKELNANAVRIIDYPPHPYVINLCDEKGLFLLEELPITWLPTSRLKSEQYFTRVKDYMSEVLSRDKFHVSIFAWGIGGPYKPEELNIINNIYEIVKQYDYHPVYFRGLSGSNFNNLVQPEIIGIDIYDVDYHDITMQIPEWLVSNNQKVKIILSLGNSLKEILLRDMEPTILQELQVLQLAETWNVLQRTKKLNGYFVHSLSDFECSYPLLTFGPRAEATVFPSGLVDYDGNKRLSFQAVRSLFQEGKVRINPGISAHIEHPSSFPLVGVILLLILLFIYNTRRYVQDNLKRIFVHSHGFFVDLRDKRKIPFSHTFLLAILSSLGLGLVAASFCYFLKEHIFFDHFLSMLFSDPHLKQRLILICWRPDLAIFIFAAFSLISFVILAVFIKIFAIIFRKKIRLSQSIILIFWIGAVFLFFVPIGMVLYRVLLIKSLFVPSLIIVILIGFWFVSRLIKALRVVYIWSASKAAIFVLIIGAMIVGGLLYYYQQHQSMLDYLKIYFTYINSMSLN